MSESEFKNLNGDTKVVLARLNDVDRRIGVLEHNVEKRMCVLEQKLDENLRWHRDHPLCPEPGLCLMLQKQISIIADNQGKLDQRLDTTRRLVYIVVGAALIVNILMPFIIHHIVNSV